MTHLPHLAAPLAAAIATSIALALSVTLVMAADTAAEQALNLKKAMWGDCGTIGEPDRDRCMVNAKDNVARGECKELMNRAQRRCMLDFLEAKHPVAGAK